MKKLLTIGLVMMALFVKAQVNNQGEIIYEEVTKMKFEMSDEQKARLKQMDITIPNSFINEKNYFLVPKKLFIHKLKKKKHQMPTKERRARF